MKPRNPIYLGDHNLEPSEDVVMIRCTHCRKSAYSVQWIANRGDCPKCARPYAGPLNDD